MLYKLSAYTWKGVIRTCVQYNSVPLFFLNTFSILVLLLPGASLTVNPLTIIPDLDKVTKQNYSRSLGRPVVWRWFEPANSCFVSLRLDSGCLSLLVDCTALVPPPSPLPSVFFAPLSPFPQTQDLTSLVLPTPTLYFQPRFSPRPPSFHHFPFPRTPYRLFRILFGACSRRSTTGCK